MIFIYVQQSMKMKPVTPINIIFKQGIFSFFLMNNVTINNMDSTIAANITSHPLKSLKHDHQSVLTAIKSRVYQ